MQPPIPPRSRDRVAGLRLPELPPRDLERLAAGPHSAPAPSTAPDSATYLPPPPATPTKFGNEGSPADVRGYPPPVTPLLMRGGVVSPGVGGGSGLVLPTLALPHSNSALPPPSQLQSVSLALPAASGLMSAPNTAPVGGPMHAALRRCGAVPNGAASVTGSVSRSGARTTPSSPVACGMSQNEIKKAQNRKSAKRFREAQKQRWKNMADDLMSHKRTIDELRSQLQAQASTVAHANNAIRAAQCMRSNGTENKRSAALSINDLVSSDGAGEGTSHTHAEAEAALYAQILSNRSNGKRDGGGHGHGHGGEPYVKELGLLTRCIVVESGSGRIVSVRRGSPNGVDTLSTDGISGNDGTEYRNALMCGKPVAVAYCRRGTKVNAVMNPVEGSDRVVVAEFCPF